MRPLVVVTDRRGGCSRAPYDENNLALHVGDDVDAVRANRAALARTLGVDEVQFMTQVHGADAAVVTTASGEDVDGVDALVAATPGVAIAVLVADCVPVVIVGTRVVAVAHAGRRGIVADVIAATVRAARRHDDGPLRAQLGPSVCGRCYEVPDDMQCHVAAAVPAARSTTRHGTAALDLPAAARAQLQAVGVAVDDGPVTCTREAAQFYSHRRDGVTGRFAAVAMLLP